MEDCFFMRKILFSALLIALSVFVLFGCGGDKPVVTEPPVTDAPVVTDPPVTNAPVVTEAIAKDVKPVEEYADFVNRVEIVGTTDKDALSYKLGEEITFNISLKYDSKEIVGCRQFDYTVMADGAEPYGERISGKDGQFSVTVPAGYIKEPGTVSIRVTAKSSKGIMLGSFIGGALVNMDEIVALTDMPDDFADFWRGNLKKLITVDPTDTSAPSGDKHESNYFHYYKMDERYMQNSINCKEMIPYLGSYDFYEVFLAAPGKMPAVFYISIPKNLKNESYPIYMHLNNYAARNAFIGKNENKFYVGVGLCGMPGVYYDEKTDTYTKPTYGGATFMDIEGDYDNPESAYATYMLLRNVQVLRFLSNPEYTKGTPFEEVTRLYNKDIDFYGGSLGGYQSISTAALVNIAADLGENLGTPKQIQVIAPSLSDISTRAAGSAGNAIRVSQNPLFRAWYENLVYFDSSHFVTFLDTQNLIIEGGFADTSCPPSGMAILYNVAKCNVTLKMTQNRTHSGEYPNTRIEYTRTK